MSEADALGLEMVASDVVAPPRLVAAPIALECQLRHCLELGESRNQLLIGEVVMIHIADGLMKNGRIDSRELNPICRLAGPNYASLGEIVTMKPVLATQK